MHSCTNARTHKENVSIAARRQIPASPARPHILLERGKKISRTRQTSTTDSKRNATHTKTIQERTQERKKEKKKKRERTSVGGNV